MTDAEIKALVPTISERPKVWYDKIRELLSQGFIAKHETAEWVNPETGERGRICYTPTKAWLRNPSTKKEVKK